MDLVLALILETSDDPSHVWADDAGTTEDSPLAWQAVEWLTYLWHFLIPVLDDITDTILLWETRHTIPEGLWWTCLGVMVVAEVERMYIILFPLCSAITWVINFVLFICAIVLEALTCGRLSFPWLVHIEWFHLDYLNFRQEYASGPEMQFDTLSWVLLGPRARSSDFMTRLGLGGEYSAQVAQDQFRGLRAIDKLVRYHPFYYLGEMIFWYPHGHHIPGEEGDVGRRAVAMTRAVGETLVVDTLFLAVGVVASGWDENLTGLASVSVLFSVVELVGELQYYAGIAVEAMVARRSPEDARAQEPSRLPSGSGHDASDSA